MIEQMKQWLEALEYRGDYRNKDRHTKRQKAITSLRQAIAKLESQEPDKYEMDIECTKCGAKQSGVLTVNTHPPQRKPLTDEQIDQLVVSELGLDADADTMHDFARAIEAAHGIKE